MYQNQLRHEQRLSTQGWVAIVNDLSRSLRRLAAMLSLSRSETLTTFTPHRVPGTDKLR